MSAVRDAITWGSYAEANLGAAKVLLDTGAISTRVYRRRSRLRRRP